MGKRKDAYVVTHSYAQHPDPGKVQAALDLWKEALAEQLICGGVVGQNIARRGLNRKHGRKT